MSRSKQYKVVVADPVPLTGEWVVGFFDGEGSLGIAGHGGAIQPRFRINQRDDDGDLVRQIHAFIGVGCLYRKPPYKGNTNAKPQLALTVIGGDCTVLVSLFDKHPLRSKKRFEYPIWREAVLLYTALKSHRWDKQNLIARRTEELLVLQSRLVASRLYGGAR